MLPLFCHPSSSASSSIPSPSSPLFSPKFGAAGKSTPCDKRRHRLRPVNCCCWLAFDVHANYVHYVPIFEEDIVRAKAVEPNALAKTICASTKTIKTFRQQHKAGGWLLNDLSAIFAYICALIDQQCAGGETNGSPPPRMPVKAVIVVPTNCSLPYQMAVEGAAEAAGIGEVFLVRRATALAISYRMLYLDEDEAQLCKQQQQQCSSIDGTETGGGGAETAALIIPLDSSSDSDQQQQGWGDKFVAILFICEYCIELSVYDFHPLHLARLISSKMLILTDPTAQIDLINTFLRRHLTIFRFKLFKLLTAGMPKQIAAIVPTIKKHIDPSSCQLLAKCPPISSAEYVAIFGAALNGVHLMLGTADADGADRSPLFLNRAMVPPFDYTDSGGDDEAAAEEVEKLQREVEAIDESFAKAFGLSKQIVSEPTTPNEMEQEEANSEKSTTPTTESDVTLSDRMQRKSGTSSSTNICCDETAEALFDAILPHDKLQQPQQQPLQRTWTTTSTTTTAKRQLTEDERQLLADVIVSSMFGATSNPTNDDDAATNSAAADHAGGSNSTIRQAVIDEQQHYAASTTSSSYACTVSSTSKQADDAVGPGQMATPANALTAAACTSSTIQCSAGFVFRAAGGVSRRFSDPLLRQRGAFGDEGRECRGNAIAAANASQFSAAILAQNAATLEAAGNNRMRWEETDDEEGEEIETLGDDRSIIFGDQAPPLLSSSECPSGISSPRLLPTRDTAGTTADGEQQQSVGAANDDDDDFGEDDNASNSTASAVELNRQPWQKRRGRTSRNKQRRQRTTADDEDAATTMAPAAAITALLPMGRPSSRASTLQAVSDDEQQQQGGGDDCDSSVRKDTTTTVTKSNSNDKNNGNNTRQMGYGDGDGRPAAQQPPTAAEPGGVRGRGDDYDDDDDLLLLIFGPQRPVADKIGNNEHQFYLPLPMFGEGALSSVQLVGLPLTWISNKFFQQEFKEWLRKRCGLRSNALISCFITFSVSAGQAFRICRFGRNSIMPYNGSHNSLFVYALLPTPQVAWHVCWACNQIDENLGNYWPAKYGQVKFKPTVQMSARQTFLDETNS
ncbi:hypothetical protein niasHT_001377 [Heterodera trifolii]|uniref:Uncharacterized protein n=1 Tax=Heterodera trifolii TaxID=157864 RepID=A0ABD2LN09_9BILA